LLFFFFSSRRRHTRFSRDWSSDVCSSDLAVKQVILPLDGTRESEAVAPQAAEFAKWLDAELMVMGVIHPSAHAEAGIGQGDVMESSYVRSRAESYESQYGVRVSWDVLYGDPVEALTEFIKG